ncbi:MAG TPA: DNA polymerase III subunit gamma/tau, partial [Patescibacteria group bacterium]
MVFYRKYRPQTISELDSTHVKETLFAVLRGKNIPHAFLFTGPKGLGKTSTARIVAKAVNCLHPKDAEPCNTCEQCVSITRGSNIDVLEIDGASNRGIDEIRELRERVKLAPSSAKKKVYIIDEVHMLTTEAFNALLKTIEEPPAHVIFIFCTTEPHKVPETILSRCFHISFSLATEQELVHSLERITNGEKIEAEKGALELIAHLAEGGFRDAAKILEEMVALSNGQILTKKFVEEKFHVTGVEKQIQELVTYLQKKQIKEALELVNNLSMQGMDIKYFLSQFLYALHEKLLVTITEKSKEFSVTELSLLLQLFSESFAQIKYATIPQLPLEIAIVA